MNANRVFGEYDRKKLCTAIKVLRYSRFSGTTLAKWIYQVAFSRTFTFSGTYRDILENVFLHGDGGTEESVIGADEEAKDITADLIKMTVPTLFGGKAVPTSNDEMFGEKRTEKVELSELFDLSENLAEHPTDLTFERLLAWDGVYVVLRPSAEIFK